MLGIPSPLCADRWGTDSCSYEAKHTETQYFSGSAKPPTSTGESPYYLEIRERIHYKYMEEEDHFTQTQLPALLLHLQLLQWQQGCCHCSSLFLSTLLYKLTTLSTFCSHSWCPFIGNNDATNSYSSSTKVAANSSSFSTMVAANL